MSVGRGGSALLHMYGKGWKQWRINAAMGWVGEFRAWGGTDTQLHYLTQK